MSPPRTTSSASPLKLKGNKDTSTSSVSSYNLKYSHKVANSGIGGPRMNPVKPQLSDDIAAIQKDLWDINPDEFLKTFSTNVSAVYFTSVAFLSLLHAGNQKLLEKTGYSSQIVVTSSIAGYSKQVQSSIAYSASKAAATHLARNLSTYFVHLQIRVNVIVPGLYPSELTGTTPSDDKGHISMEGREKLWDDVPAKRPGLEREIAGLGMFLARYPLLNITDNSPAGGYLNGAVIVTDGGRLSVRPSVF
jgi:NAD(P)-dependent dehydrogenase (short-subunit alcohol dehydrogenase family)